jgi:hypothetical protein
MKHPKYFGKDKDTYYSQRSTTSNSQTSWDGECLNTSKYCNTTVPFQNHLKTKKLNKNIFVFLFLEQLPEKDPPLHSKKPKLSFGRIAISTKFGSNGPTDVPSTDTDSKCVDNLQTSNVEIST